MITTYAPNTAEKMKNIEFNYEAEWDKFCSDSATSKRFIRFGNATTFLDSKNDITVTKLEGVETSDGKNSVPLVCGSTFVSSNIFPFKNVNVHRSGAAHASSFKGAIPTGVVSPLLMKAVHSGALNQVTLCMAAFLASGANDDSQATVIQAQEFFNCIFTFVDLTTFPYLTIFEFSYTKHKVTQQDFSQKTEGYGNTIATKVSYEFDYATGSGKKA